MKIEKKRVGGPLIAEKLAIYNYILILYVKNNFFIKKICVVMTLTSSTDENIEKVKEMVMENQ